MSLKQGLFICSAKRTAFGAFGGSLKNLTAGDLADIVCRSALKAASVAPENVDEIIVGNVIQSAKDAAYIARHVGIRIGLPIEVPGLAVNRLCATGFSSIISACQTILLGENRVVLAAGAESMTQAPFAVRNVRFGTFLGQNIEFEDTLWQGLTDQLIKTPMGVTAENLGEQYKLTRQECDEYALQSQTRWRLANNAGYFKEEIEPVMIKTKKGEVAFQVDEHPRDTTMEILGKLPPVFKKVGLVTAGNASGIVDGAAAVVVASEDAVKEFHLNPIARVVGWQAVGCDPHIMGYGPVPAIRKLMKNTGMSLDKIELVEINEAFAPQVVACQRELKIDNDIFNVNGGAIAFGHPLGATGTRVSVHVIHELRRRNIKYGIGSACVGGGMGCAMLFESIL
jgi:acetyl-CoA acyltransferase 2